MESPQDIIVSVNQTATEIVTLPNAEVAISAYRLSLETDSSALDYLPDLCGSVYLTVELEDGRELPEFMVFDESDQTL